MTLTIYNGNTIYVLSLLVADPLPELEEESESLEEPESEPLDEEEFDDPELESLDVPG